MMLVSPIQSLEIYCTNRIYYTNRGHGVWRDLPEALVLLNSRLEGLSDVWPCVGDTTAALLINLGASVHTRAMTSSCICLQGLTM